jgi:hypothetical protein
MLTEPESIPQGERKTVTAVFADIKGSTESVSEAWELRTTMSLARLLDNTGHRDEARPMLVDVDFVLGLGRARSRYRRRRARQRRFGGRVHCSPSFR